MSVSDPETALSASLRRAVAPIAFVGLFSFISNLLYFALPIYTNQVYSRVLASQSGATLLVLTIAVLFVFVVSGILDMLRQQILNDFGAEFDRNVAPSIFRALFNAAARRQTSPSAQALRDIDNVRDVFTGPAVAVLFDLPWIPIFLGSLFVVGFPIGMVGLVGSLALLTLAFAQDQTTRKSLEKGQAASISTYNFTESALRNSEVVRALGMLPTMGERWGAARNAGTLRRAQVLQRQNVFGGLIKLVRIFVQVLIVGVGAWLVIRGKLSPSVMFANMILSGRALSPIDRIVGSWNSMVTAWAAYRRLRTLLDAPENLSAESRMLLPRPSGELRVEDLTFGAPTGARVLLASVSFALSAGETMGVIGPSGAGKSTLARLLVGIWSPFRGAVRLDGSDVFLWERAGFGQFVGYLPQGVELFSGSVRDNIARFQPGATDAAVYEAAELAGAHEMIARLPQGYETEIGDGGLVLSAGQRQRVGLARAVFGTPAFVVLDEPNAALDGEGEDALGGALRRLKAAGCTVVIISHKPQALRTADKVLVLNDGRVQMFGPRDEVLNKMATSSRAAAEVIAARAGASARPGAAA